MIIGKDGEGLLHIVVGPEEIEDNLPTKVAEALLKGCRIDLDARAGSVSELFLKGQGHDGQGLYGLAEAAGRNNRQAEGADTRRS